MSRNRHSQTFFAFHRLMRANVFMSFNIFDMQVNTTSIYAFGENFRAFVLNVLFKLFKLYFVLGTTVYAFECSVLHDLLSQEMNILRFIKFFPTPVTSINTLVSQTRSTS